MQRMKKMLPCIRKHSRVLMNSVIGVKVIAIELETVRGSFKNDLNQLIQEVEHMSAEYDCVSSLIGMLSRCEQHVQRIRTGILKLWNERTM